jgi:hypothetical protein
MSLEIFKLSAPCESLSWDLLFKHYPTQFFTSDGMEFISQRRAAVRYKLRLPVIFHWYDGGERTEGGFTSDVALDGAFIRSKRFPPAGSEVRIEVLIPPPYETGDEVRIHCIGRVTRVVNQDGFSGFGVVGDFDDDDLTLQVLTNPRD